VERSREESVGERKRMTLGRRGWMEKLLDFSPFRQDG